MVSSSRHLLLQRYARLDLGSAQARWIFGGKLCKIWTLPCAKERLRTVICPGAAADINRLRLPLPDCALPDRSAGRAQQRQRVDHSDDRNHREGQRQFPITPHAARSHQLRTAQVGDHIHCQECR